MIENLKQLKAFLKLCRSEGVESIKFGSVEVHLGNLPLIPEKRQKVSQVESVPPQSFAPGGITAESKIIPEEISFDDLTEEQKLFYSVTSEQQ